MNANQAMKVLLHDLRLDQPLIPSLKRIAETGFEVRDGCYFLREFAELSRGSRANFIDATGYECFANAIHIEDYEEISPLVQALLFVERAFGVWNATQPAKTLAAVVSADEYSVVVRFHVHRAGEQWLQDDIEGYEDPVLSVGSEERVLDRPV
jgi:hypothetical protein